MAMPILGSCLPITRVDFGALVDSGVGDGSLMIPEGFTARRIARTGDVVQKTLGGSTGYTWHGWPDGGGVFPIIEDLGAGPEMTGWVYTSNSELGSGAGGCGAIEFDAAGNVVDAYSILSGTDRNCAGGVMPFDSGWRWISCEEVDLGANHECDPYGVDAAVARPAMGLFHHEACAADPDGQRIYQTEDNSAGGFYRFTPDTWGDLSSGTLEVMTETAGVLGWAAIDPTGSPTRCRNQVPTMKVFNRGEGCWFTDGTVYFSTTGDNKVWAYVPATNTLTEVYNSSSPSVRHLTNADNLVAVSEHRVFVAEDSGNMEIVGLDVSTGRTYPIIEYRDAAGTGTFSGSEITGPAFIGDRLYFSSQRNPGETFEVQGPWNENAPEA